MRPLFKTLLFTVIIPGSVAAWIPWWILASKEHVGLGLPTGLRLLGWPLMGLGLGFYAWCAWDFATFGRGTPAPIDPPRVLVARGLYRTMRNPMYVGVCAVLLGEVLVSDSKPLLVFLIGTWICMYLFVLLYEEPALSRKFGMSYEDYRRRVPRWIPRLWPRRAR